MKKYFCRIILAAAAIILLDSCLPEREYLFSDAVMCSVINPVRLKSDGGNIYNIVENSTGSLIPDTLKRVMISCDVLSATASSPSEYDIRIIDFMAAFSKDPVYAGSIEEGGTAGDDPVKVTQAWISGGYLNSYINLLLRNPSEVDHDFNLVYDDSRSTSDTLYFRMCHDAKGETPDDTGLSVAHFVTAGTYVSFPIESILPQSDKSKTVYLEWEWFDSDDGSYSTERKTFSAKIIIQ